MVRQRPVVRWALGLVLALALRAFGDTKAPEVVPIDRRPYNIEVHIGIDPDARIDGRGRAILLADWRQLVRRFVGAPWELELAGGDSPLSLVPLESLGGDAFAKAAPKRDKIWVIHIHRDGAQLEIQGREFDATVKRLGPLRRRVVPFVADLPRALFQLTLDLFAPTAQIGESSGGGVSITVRGASLDAASHVGRVVSVGSVFLPIRLVELPDGKSRLLSIPFSFLRVESLDGPVARCGIVSALRDPLTRRIATKNTLLAIGIKPGDQPTRLRFITRPNKSPAAGYVLTARKVPDGPPREVGMTDREGRIVLEPGFADGLVALRLLAGSVEPMVELPLMPGDNVEERTIPFDPKPATVALETQLDSLRDAILDLVAVRARLEARLKARADGEDWNGLAETLQEFTKLPPRTQFAERLTQLKEEATGQQAKTKTAILTKTAQAQVAEVQALIDRYLDDEIFSAYRDALDRHNAELTARAKAKTTKKAAPRFTIPTKSVPAK